MPAQRGPDSPAARRCLAAPFQEGRQLRRQAMRQLLAHCRADVPGSLLAAVDTLTNEEKRSILNAACSKEARFSG